MLPFLLFVCVLLIGMIGTYSYISHILSQENNMQSSNEYIRINEIFPDDSVIPGGSRVKQVQFENTGTASVFLRASFSESWTSEIEAIVGLAEVTKVWTSSWTNEWELADDGWYYYKRTLPPGAQTERILESVTFPVNIPDESDYQLTFLVETIQCSDEQDVNADATQTLFGRRGVVNNGSVVWD